MRGIFNGWFRGAAVAAVVALVFLLAGADSDPERLNSQPGPGRGSAEAPVSGPLAAVAEVARSAVSGDTVADGTPNRGQAARIEPAVRSEQVTAEEGEVALASADEGIVVSEGGPAGPTPPPEGSDDGPAAPEQPATAPAVDTQPNPAEASTTTQPAAMEESTTTQPATTQPPTTRPATMEQSTTTQPPTTAAPVMSTTTTTTAAASEPCAVTVAKRTPLKDGPGGERIGRVDPGVYPLLASQGGWYQITADGQVGWIKANKKNQLTGDC